MRNSVLDSHAILAYLLGETGSRSVGILLEKSALAQRSTLVAAPNWAEVRYQVERKLGETAWQEIRTILLGLPIEIVPADQKLAEVAGEIKARRRMSLADCFAAALARERKADVYTGDPEFREVEGEIRIVWI